MSYGKSRLAGVLAIAVLGVLAFAASAQAVTPGFLINKTAVGALKASFSAKQLGRGTLSIPALKTEINCEKFSVINGFVNSTIDAELQLLYEECTVLTNEVGKLEEAFGCEIVVNHEGGVQKHHITAKALLLPTELTDGTPAILVEKIEALILTKTEMGCLLPKTTTIKGELCLKVDKSDTLEPELLASEELQGLCKERTALEASSEGAGVKDKILFGTNEAFITSKTDIALSGVHSGLSLGVTSSVVPIEKPTLCKAKEGACEAYGLGTKLSLNLENEVKFVFPYEGEELEPPCRVSSISAAATKEGEVLTGELTALTFKECGGGLCTVTAQHLPYKFAIKATAGGNGTMIWSSGGGGAPAVGIKCLGAAKCIYGATEMTFTITGGSPAKLSNSGVALKREAGSGEACGETGAKWEGVAAVEGKILYKITSPSPLFVRAI